MIMKERIEHQFGPVYDKNSKILILGSFPSVKSRQEDFYYMHPQNRFYQILSKIFKEDFVNLSINDKIKLLNKCHIALYDVVFSCIINLSSDQSIKEPIACDIEKILKETEIKRIYLNGKKAFELFKKFFPHLLPMAKCLPSSSPANAKYSLDELVREWNVIKNDDNFEYLCDNR